MHKRGIAHRYDLCSLARGVKLTMVPRNCTTRHIMMDATGMFPSGFHPVQTRYLPDYSELAPRLSRSSVPVKYYFVDFSVAVRVPAGNAVALATGMFHTEPEVPEMSFYAPYDAFLVDVFILGHMIDRELCLVRHARSRTSFL